MSGILQSGPLVIDISSLPTLYRRLVKELPGTSFECHQSAREGKVIVRVTVSQAGHDSREAFRRVVQSL